MVALNQVRKTLARSRNVMEIRPHKKLNTDTRMKRSVKPGVKTLLKRSFAKTFKSLELGL